MNEPDASEATDAPRGEEGGAPWIDLETQGRMQWRDGDVVVSVPAKSGTTWTMNIVHQLRTGGDADFEDVYVEVPWLEFVERPGQTPNERLHQWEAMPTTRRRAFKSHAAPPMLPYVEPGQTDVRYVVVLRNPEEALVSLKPFIEQHSPAFFELWGAPKEVFLRDDFATFFDEVLGGARIVDALFGFLAAWWPLRNRPNVLMIHFTELKRDHEGSIRRIADFLGEHPSETQWPAILEHCSFSWMKANQRKFELPVVTDVPVLDPGAMIRKGQVGTARDDGMTEAIAARVRTRGAEILDDPVAMEWYYRGGPTPA
ncbi:sulfotransferase domain-containing protein [Paraliomyxa miuraensis]|uniref:sulfotransferase domain-containing protein n=1 Tax=Paraliomyxa miuraensis TaxID=376150 RepID=UPI002250B6CB|nr:sulfotransferase domain-containing protein [Paraliomyxa miuraensis]MCX4246734.1 sulfotransferase domain-containing protein [Paraliomyxa miuraensis]